MLPYQGEKGWRLNLKMKYYKATTRTTKLEFGFTGSNLSTHIARTKCCCSFTDLSRKHFFFLSEFFFHNHSLITGLQGKDGGENSSLPLPPASQTLRHQPSDCRRELISGHSSQTDSNWEPLVSECKSLTIKLHALKKTIAQIILAKAHISLRELITMFIQKPLNYFPCEPKFQFCKALAEIEIFYILFVRDCYKITMVIMYFTSLYYVVKCFLFSIIFHLLENVAKLPW